MARGVSEWVPGCRVDAAIPRTATIFRVATDAVVKIRRKDADPVVDSARLPCLRCAVRRYGALPAAACKLGDVAADNLAGHTVWISASVIQPVEEMRQPYGISALGIGGTIALTQFSQELIA